jgi:aminoglycoside 6'-N-acetyltransferase
VTLRPLEEADIPPLAELLSHPEVAEWWPVASEASLREDVAGDDETVAMAIEVEGKLAGLIMYEEVLWRDYFTAGIDIGLGGDYVQRGLGTEALRLLARWLIDVGGHHRLQIDPAAKNARAIRAYEKVGFRPVGIMRKYERGPDGEWRDSLLMDLLAEELTDIPQAP